MEFVQANLHIIILFVTNVSKQLSAFGATMLWPILLIIIFL